jgi:hypothetical protein
MKTRSHRLPVTGLRSVQNARSRIYVPGSDPVFNSNARSGTTIRLVPAFPDDKAATVTSPTLRPNFVDRLQPPVTRYHE